MTRSTDTFWWPTGARLHTRNDSISTIAGHSIECRKFYAHREPGGTPAGQSSSASRASGRPADALWWADYKRQVVKRSTRDWRRVITQHAPCGRQQLWHTAKHTILHIYNEPDTKCCCGCHESFDVRALNCRCALSSIGSASCPFYWSIWLFWLWMVKSLLFIRRRLTIRAMRRNCYSG